MNEKLRTITISFQPIKIKLFCSKKKKSLLVVEGSCINGSINRIRPGNGALIHVRHSSFISSTIDGGIDSLATALMTDEEHITLSHLKKGCWTDADRTKLMVLKANPTIERNRRGDRLIECTEILSVQERTDYQYLPTNSDDEYNEFVIDGQSCMLSNSLQAKSQRHEIFAHWLIETYGKEYLSKGTGVIDVAGGNGAISNALLELGIQATLLDPNPRGFSEKKGQHYASENDGELVFKFGVIPHALIGDGSDLTSRDDNGIGHTITNCSLICGLHPDQATEPIVALALRLNVPFAIA